MFGANVGKYSITMVRIWDRFFGWIFQHEDSGCDRDFPQDSTIWMDWWVNQWIGLLGKILPGNQSDFPIVQKMGFPVKIFP